MESHFPIIDIHAHVLPGLDDGPATMDDALRMCELYIAEGVTTVVATPHMCEGRFGVRPAAVRRGVDALASACQERGLGLRLLPGADVRLVPELLEALDAGEALTVGDGGRYLLLELPFQVVPRLEQFIFDLGLRGITPVLTHPERNLMLSRRPHVLAELIDRGCLVQVTADALFGCFGPGPREAAECFLHHGLVHVVASDAHSPRERRPRLRRAAERLAALGGDALARDLLWTNPEAIVGARGLVPAEEHAAQRQGQAHDEVATAAS